MNDIGVSMAREMEIARDSIDLEPSDHPATFAGSEIGLHSLLSFISVLSLRKDVSLRQIVFPDRSPNVNLMDLEDVFDVQTQH